MPKYICDCGARYSDEAGILACAGNNHGAPRAPVYPDQVHAVMRAYLDDNHRAFGAHGIAVYLDPAKARARLNVERARESGKTLHWIDTTQLITN